MLATHSTRFAGIVVAKMPWMQVWGKILTSTTIACRIFNRRKRTVDTEKIWLQESIKKKHVARDHAFGGTFARNLGMQQPGVFH